MTALILLGPRISAADDLALQAMKIYGVPMIVKAVKVAPRLVMSLVFAVTLWLAVLLVAVASVLGLTLALTGWASNPP